MEGAYDDAKAIREEIQKFKSRHIMAKASDKCALCRGFLLTRPFHLFVCGHKFHTDCLIREVLPHLSPARSGTFEFWRHFWGNPHSSS